MYHLKATIHIQKDKYYLFI